VLFVLGPLSATVGELVRASLLVSRFAAFMAIMTLYSAATSLSDTVRALTAGFRPLGALGFPVQAATLIVGIALRFVPILVEEAERIVVAQLSRGGGYTGKGRFSAALALMVPLLLRSLERAEALGSAMELRLFEVSPRSSPEGTHR